jgi:putative nucleotidyltransferase with HDIG domain
MTVSAGICDLSLATGSEDLAHLADGALYRAKANGRDVVVVYSPDVVQELSEEERAERLARQGNLASLRSLAQAVDAKDPHTRRHSERVAGLAVRLATTLGWPPAACARIREAGLLHDVGKIGVPGAILLRPGPLTALEYEQVKVHAELGAEIASEVLAPEQVLWVRHHHERADGAGYPDGLAEAELSEGALIMAVADSWVAMTGDREYRYALSLADALGECRREAGHHFAEHVVTALERLAETGALASSGATDRAPSPIGVPATT